MKGGDACRLAVEAAGLPQAAIDARGYLEKLGAANGTPHFVDPSS